jgi:hypothetical protein
MGVTGKMTIGDWVNVGVMVATIALVVSTLGLIVSNRILIRMNRPNRTPEPSQPKSRIQRIWGWFLRFSQSPWQLPPFLILTNLFTLVLELRRTAPVTRWAVYQISASVAGVFYGAVLLLLNIAWQSIRRQWQINAEQSKIDREIIDILRSLASDSYTIDGKIVDLVRSLAIGLHTTAETLALEQKVRQLETEQAELEKSGQGRLSRLLKVLLGD